MLCYKYPRMIFSHSNITKPLIDDGYAHALTQLQQALAQLADEIIVALQKPLTAKKSKHSRVDSFD